MIGASVGSASVDAGVINGPFVDPTTLSEGTSYVRLFGAFDLNTVLAIDGSLFVFSDIETSLDIADTAPIYPGHYSNQFSVEMRTFTLGMTASWSFADRWRFRVGGGAAFTFSDSQLSGDRYGGFEDTSDGVLGYEGHVDIDYSLTEKLVLGLRAGYLDLGTDLGTSDKATSTNVELSLAYRF